MEKNIDTFVFKIEEYPSNNKPENYVKMMLEHHSCLSVQARLTGQDLSTEQRKDIHTFWTECGHRIRQKLNDDSKLERLLRKVLPQYTGGNITLYRGENRKRYDDKAIGFCWTSLIEVAEMFAQGLNSHAFGGLVLQYTFSADQVISGPSDHSLYLQENEYTATPSSLDFEKITILKSYPATR